MNFKGIIALLLGIMLLAFTACGTAAAPEAAATAAPTAEPTLAPTAEPAATPEPTPATSAATVCVLKAPAILAMLEENTVVTVEEDMGDYCLVSCDAGCGYVEKRLLAPKDAEPYETWTAYTQGGAELRENHHLRGEVLRVFTLNETVTVKADLQNCYLVELDDGTCGYVKRELLGKTPFVVYYGGGGGGSSGGQDGGDITLGYKVETHPAAVLLADTETDTPVMKPGSSVRVISLRAELIAAWFDLNDEVRVISEKDGVCALYIDGVTAEMERRFLIFDGENAPEGWDGYAVNGAILYDNFYLMENDASVSLALNTEIHVLADLDDCLLVSTGGMMGYMDKDAVSETYIYYHGGGGVEWTEPVL